MVVKIYTAKMISNTTPCRMVVRPVRNDSKIPLYIQCDKGHGVNGQPDTGKRRAQGEVEAGLSIKEAVILNVP